MPTAITFGSVAARAFGFLGRVLRKDAFFNYVTMLLPGNGTNGAQNNTFLDSSTNNFTITRNGNTTQGTFTPYGPNWSNYFDGSGDYLSAASNAAFDFGTGDFTLEAWVYRTSSTGGSPIVTNSDTAGSTNNNYFFLGYAGSGVGYFEIRTTGGSTSTTGTINGGLNTWVHLAVSRESGTVKLFINGALDKTITITSACTQRAVLVGGFLYPGFSEYFPGYISNLRIVKGTAVYTAAFTPPTTPLTAITNTSLLTCQSNRFIDNSSNNFTITRNGDVSVQRFSPFSQNAPYSSSVNGGSGYFDGTGDYLSVADNTVFDIGSGAFTVEAFVYITANSNYGLILGQWGSAGNNAYVLRQAGTTYYPEFVYTTNGSTEVVAVAGTTALPLSQWVHVAVSRNGSNTISMFVNGTRVATNGSFTATIYNSSANVLTGGESAGAYTTGYISNARLVKGTAVYDPTLTTLTVPTAPLTAVTNTSLLLNFNNGGIIDNAMMNDLETVGNAQISTTQSKFGGSSMYFDGTGDWLLVPHTADQLLGTGNFTIECWLYLGATGAARGVVGKGTATTGWLLSTDSSNKVVFTYGSSTITSTAALSGSTWYHIAVVREGTGTNQTKIYIGGTNDGTGTVSTDFTQTNAMYVGANRTGGDALNGYIDDLRITKGVARYTANFTPPTAAFPTQ